MNQNKISIRLIVLIGLFFSGCMFKSMPIGTNYKSPVYSVAEDDLEFMFDLTYKNSDGKIVSEQEIFDSIFSLISDAHEYILLDLFLFNPYTGSGESVYRKLSSELTERLISKKRENDSIKIDFITDPVNIVYGGSESEQIEKMKEAGINVIITDLTKMKDSNLLYSPLWRVFFQWFGNSECCGILPHPFSQKDKKVTFRSYFELLNFKANHRKVIVADHNGEMISIITSANPHDGSSAHSNVAVVIKGDFWKEVYYSESAIAKFSKRELHKLNIEKNVSMYPEDKENIGEIALLTEESIRDELLEMIDCTQKGDSLSMGMFYLADRKIIKSLIDASKRGTDIRLILDPSKDAFGRQKNGIPNRPVAEELIKKSNGKIKIRWYLTHGEQFHTKFVLVNYSNNVSKIILGSANLTRRNIGNYNLESNVYLKAKFDYSEIVEVKNYFEMLWENQNGNVYTAKYELYGEENFLKHWMYRFFEFTGTSTF